MGREGERARVTVVIGCGTSFSVTIAGLKDSTIGLTSPCSVTIIQLLIVPYALS